MNHRSIHSLAAATILCAACNLEDPAPFVPRPGDMTESLDMRAPIDTPPDTRPDSGDDMTIIPPVEEMGADMPGESMCGDGEVTGSETCDGDDCPVDPSTDCGDLDVCDIASIRGEASQCTAMCMVSRTSTCTDDDGCCPISCSPGEDSDCTSPRLAAGLPCDAETMCGDNRLCTNELLGGDDGFCTGACEADSDCLEGEACTQVNQGPKFCLAPCEGVEDCSEELICARYEDFTTSAFCVPPRFGPTKIGEPCMSGSDCGDGEQCITESSNELYVGGYCTDLCDPEQCVGNTLCHAIDPNNAAATSFCYSRCAEDNDCRDGYRCLLVAEGQICLP